METTEKATRKCQLTETECLCIRGNQPRAKNKNKNPQKAKHDTKTACKPIKQTVSLHYLDHAVVPVPDEVAELGMGHLAVVLVLRAERPGERSMLANLFVALRGVM